MFWVTSSSTSATTKWRAYVAPALTYLAMLVSMVLAAPIDTTSDVQSSAQSILADVAVVGVVFIVTGLLFTFFGGKMFRLCMFLAGAYLMALIALSILQRVEPSEGFSNRKAVYWGVTLAAGLIGGFLLTWFYKLGLLAIGAFGGYTLAMFLLSLSSGGLIKSQGGQIAFIAVLAILGAIAVFKIERHAVIISTSMGGAYLTVLGIDVFAQTGFTDAMIQFAGSEKTSFTATGKVYAMVGTTLVLAILGIVFQYRRGHNHLKR